MKRDPEELDLGFYHGLAAEGRRDRSLPLGDQFNVARPGCAAWPNWPRHWQY